MLFATTALPLGEIVARDYNTNKPVEKPNDLGKYTAKSAFSSCAYCIAYVYTSLSTLPGTRSEITLSTTWCTKV